MTGFEQKIMWSLILFFSSVLGFWHQTMEGMYGMSICITNESQKKKCAQKKQKNFICGMFAVVVAVFILVRSGNEKQYNIS